MKIPISHYFDTAGTDQTISYTITYPYNDQEEYAYVITKNITEDTNDKYAEAQVYKVKKYDDELVIKDVTIPYLGIYWLTAEHDIRFTYDEIRWW